MRWGGIGWGGEVEALEGEEKELKRQTFLTERIISRLALYRDLLFFQRTFRIP